MRQRTLTLNPAERLALQQIRDSDARPYLRERAAALLKIADGLTPHAVADHGLLKRRKPDTVYAWLNAYQQHGLAGLRVRAGRGRKPKAQVAQIERYVRQSPRQFGVPRTRWTLQTLAQVVPSLKGFSPFGVQKALARAGYHYKRGQPSLHSPDPDYEVKKGLWTKP